VIVVDTNVLINLALNGEGTALITQWIGFDPDWIVPKLWQCEFANAMLEMVKRDDITPDFASAPFATSPPNSNRASTRSIRKTRSY
jgi:hypothetical protein